MPDARDAWVDRHLAGELSLAEQRGLAQTALDDAELFDLIITIAAVKAVVLNAGPLDAFVGASAGGEAVPHRPASSSGREQWAKGAVPRPISQRLTLGVGIAAAVVLTFIMLPRRPERPAPGPPAVERRSPGAPTGAAARPHLLAPRLGEPDEPRAGSEVRPAAGEASRPPRREGAITALAGGVASIDLGSLDGLSRGMELPVVRATATATPAVVGRLTVTTTSLERGQGRADVAGTLQVGDRFQTEPSVYLTAVAAQVAASIGGGDLPAARTLAENAVTAVESAGLPADSRRVAFAQLGAVEYRVQAFAESARHYRSAQASLDAAPVASAAERARILNELGAVMIAQGDYPEAAGVLLAAQSAAGATGAVAGQVANNLAALASLRGDRAQAASLYAAALALVDGSQAPSRADRRVIEENLAALGPQR